MNNQIEKQAEKTPFGTFAREAKGSICTFCGAIKFSFLIIENELKQTRKKMEPNYDFFTGGRA